ncbi:unnamed protein product, partial [Tenebrio molitor]
MRKMSNLLTILLVFCTNSPVFGLKCYRCVSSAFNTSLADCLQPIEEVCSDNVESCYYIHKTSVTVKGCVKFPSIIEGCHKGSKEASKS